MTKELNLFFSLLSLVVIVSAVFELVNDPIVLILSSIIASFISYLVIYYQTKDCPRVSGNNCHTLLVATIVSAGVILFLSLVGYFFYVIYWYCIHGWINVGSHEIDNWFIAYVTSLVIIIIESLFILYFGKTKKCPEWNGEDDETRDYDECWLKLIPLYFWEVFFYCILYLYAKYL